MKWKVIYEPSGKAGEYAPLAANLYSGCAHGCRYCYAPDVLRKSPDEFSHPRPRVGVLDDLAKDIEKLRGDPRPVFLCFTCDPYQPIEKEHRLTRRAIEMLGAAGMRVRVLTKNGPLAMERDLDLFRRFNVDFGTTLLFTRDSDAREWEPNAAPLAERIGAVIMAHQWDVPTWVSVEPVIDPAQALEVIRRLAHYVDTFKIGKLNHHKDLEAAVDWTRFLADVFEVIETADVDGYYIKQDLWAFADADLRRDVPQSRISMRAASRLERRTREELKGGGS